MSSMQVKYNYYQQHSSEDYHLDDGQVHPHTQKPNHRRSNIVIIVALVCGLGLLAAAGFKSSSLSKSNFQFSFSSSASDLPEGAISVRAEDNSDKYLYLTSTNEYGVFNAEKSRYPFLHNSLLLEPFRESTVSLHASKEDCSYAIAFVSLSSDSPGIDYDINTFNTASWGITVKQLGRFGVEVTESCPSTISTKFVGSAWVKYVRRELSSLSEADRDEFLDALLTLYQVNTKDGIARFGDNYKSVAYLAAIHQDAASNPVCDEFHPVSGFLNAHLYLGSYLEQSLQLVNPRVSLHFMEFAPWFSSWSFQQHLAMQLDGGSWFPYMSETYFGESDPVTGRIINGRWANITIPSVNADFFANELIEEATTFFPAEEESWVKISAAHMSSPYGLLRPPWNFNPSEFISRYNAESGIVSMADSDANDYFMGANCEDYVDFVTSSKASADFDTVVRDIGKYLHGHLHENIGGHGGANAAVVDAKLRGQFGFTDDDILVVIERSHFFNKQFAPGMDQSNYAAYPLNCESSSDSSFSCSCHSFYFESADALDDLVSIYFDKYTRSQFPQHNNTVAKIAALTFSDASQVMQLLCSRMGFDGDLVGSSAAMDPIFWVAHPAMERILQRATFAGYITNYAFTTTNSCSGHSSDAALAWLQGFELQDVSSRAELLSNGELTAMLDPRSDDYSSKLSYIYDTIAPIGCNDVDALL